MPWGIYLGTSEFENLPLDDTTIHNNRRFLKCRFHSRDYIMVSSWIAAPLINSSSCFSRCFDSQLFAMMLSHVVGE